MANIIKIRDKIIIHKLELNNKKNKYYKMIVNFQ